MASHAYCPQSTPTPMRTFGISTPPTNTITTPCTSHSPSAVAVPQPFRLPTATSDDARRQSNLCLWTPIQTPSQQRSSPIADGLLAVSSDDSRCTSQETAPCRDRPCRHTRAAVVPVKGSPYTVRSHPTTSGLRLSACGASSFGGVTPEQHRHRHLWTPRPHLSHLGGFSRRDGKLLFDLAMHVFPTT